MMMYRQFNSLTPTVTPTKAPGFTDEKNVSAKLIIIASSVVVVVALLCCLAILLVLRRRRMAWIKSADPQGLNM